MKVQSQFIEMFGNPVTNPKGWKTSKIKDVAPESPSKESVDGRVWLLNLDMIESNTGKVIEKVYEDSENALSVQPFDEGNVLFSKLRPYLNKVVIPDEPGLATTELVPLRPKGDILNKIFFSHLLRGDQFVNFANDIAGGTKMPRMPLSELRKFECILPPMEEQMKFVAIAELADKSKFVGFKSQFIEMFGDPVSWQTDTSLPTLNDTVNVISGFPFDSEKFDTEGVGTPLIRNRDIQRGYSETFTTEVFDEQYRIKKYELLVGMDGMFDIARWQSDEAALNQRVCCLRMKGSENDTFIQYLVQPILKHIENGTNATTVKHISTKQINGIRVPIASHEQKNKFAMIANQADKSKYYYQIA